MALSPWVRTVAFCENDRYAQAVLLSRMGGGELHAAPIWDDVRTLHGADFGCIPIDIITGGFPCQDISHAGRGVGLEGERSGLFFEIVRLVGELRPRFVFLENSPAITVRGLDRVLLEFTALGYDCRWTIVSAGELGAPHLRERWFLLAHANGERLWQQSNRITWSEGPTFAEHNGQEVYPSPDATSEGLERWLDARPAWESFALGGGGGSWPSWVPQPAIRRTDAGFPYRVDKLRGVGNACPPQQYREAFKRLMGLQ